jgi:hypothetical protein
MSAATSYRVGVASMRLLSKRSPELMKLAREAWEPTATADDAARAYGEGLIDWFRESADAALDELQRGIEDVDAYLDAARAPREAAPYTPLEPL